jgi:hypothetical protein
MIGAITMVVELEKMLELRKLLVEMLLAPQAQRHPAATMASALAAIN